MSAKAERPKVMHHNHFTRDIKPLGQCPECDRYHAQVSKTNDKPMTGVTTSMTKKMTTTRFAVLLNALGRAEDEWEADADDAINPHEVRENVRILRDARQALIARFPDQFSQITSGGSTP